MSQRGFGWNLGIRDFESNKLCFVKKFVPIRFIIIINKLAGAFLQSIKVKLNISE